MLSSPSDSPAPTKLLLMLCLSTLVAFAALLSLVARKDFESMGTISVADVSARVGSLEYVMSDVKETVEELNASGKAAENFAAMTKNPSEAANGALRSRSPTGGGKHGQNTKSPTKDAKKIGGGNDGGQSTKSPAAGDQSLDVKHSTKSVKAKGDDLVLTTTGSPTLPIIHDFTSCENVQKELGKKEFLEGKDGDRDYRLVRLGATNPCLDGYSDMMVFFMWHHNEEGDAKDLCQEKEKKSVQVAYWQSDNDDPADIAAEPFMVKAQLTGCFGDQWKHIYRFYAARLMGLKGETSYKFYLQHDKHPKQEAFRKFTSAPIAGSHHETEIMIVGDTDLPGAEQIMNHLASDAGWNDLVIHLGDLTYGSNTGECYGHKFDRGSKDPCGWDCVGLECSAAGRMNSAVGKVLAWSDAYTRSVKGRMPWMSTMGNHDNEAFWFFAIRPTVMGAMPGVHPSDLAFDSEKSLDTIVNTPMSQNEVMMFTVDRMKDPFFYSFDYGLVHVISLGSEDNPFGPYEAWDGKPLDDALAKRFAQHYGRESRQYQWLIKDLSDAVARREKVPWIIVFTHRPMYHTAEHHAWCSADGDWYGCLFRDTYEPLYRQFGVDIVLSGHSHHYSRSHPMYNGKVDLEKGTIHATVGIGGYETTGERWTGSPEWIAHRQGTTLGFVKFRVVNATHAKWIHYSPTPGTTNVEVLDETWMKRRNT